MTFEMSLSLFKYKQCLDWNGLNSFLDELKLSEFITEKDIRKLFSLSVKNNKIDIAKKILDKFLFTDKQKIAALLKADNDDILPNMIKLLISKVHWERAENCCLEIVFFLFNRSQLSFIDKITLLTQMARSTDRIKEIRWFFICCFLEKSKSWLKFLQKQFSNNFL